MNTTDRRQMEAALSEARAQERRTGETCRTHYASQAHAYQCACAMACETRQLMYVWWITNAGRLFVVTNADFLMPHSGWRLVDIAKPAGGDAC